MGRQIRPLLEVRALAPGLERAARGGGEVDRRFGMAPAAQEVEPEQDSGRADVEFLKGRRRLVRVPFLGGPERDRVEVGVGVRDDAADRVAGQLVVPGRLCQRLVPLRLEEHGDIIEPWEGLAK